MLSDIEIAQQAKMLSIKDIAVKLNIAESDLTTYGDNVAKVTNYNKYIDNSKKQGNLILVTAMSPTKYGIGKTTVSIGLADALSLKDKKVCLALREPSLGPVFGIKGGAAGGGYSQVVPMEEINLSFTGDFDAITAANNLLCEIPALRRRKSSRCPSFLIHSTSSSIDSVFSTSTVLHHALTPSSIHFF